MTTVKWDTADDSSLMVGRTDDGVTVTVDKSIPGAHGYLVFRATILYGGLTLYSFLETRTPRDVVDWADELMVAAIMGRDAKADA